MVSGNVTKFYAVVLTLAMLAHRASTSYITKPQFNWDETKYLLAFGDSYTFVQGTAGYPKYSFIGSYLPDDFSFTPEELLSNKIVQNYTGTANGGPNWVEYLTGCGVEPGKTSPQSCEIQLWDFAFAGADISEEFLPLHHDYTIPLVNQTQQYLTWAEPVIGGDIDKSKAMVAIWIGINDISDSADYDDEDISLPELYDKLIATVMKQSVQPLYEVGYKSFLFVNLPPLDRTEDNAGEEHPLLNKTMIGWWAESLEKHSRSFSAANPVAKTMIYDANSFLNHVLDNPDSYGIKDTTSYCKWYDQLDDAADAKYYGCRPLDEYFWYNSAHMSSQAHKVMTADLVKFLESESTNKR